MNKWVAMGRLCADPEVRYSTGENATAIARFSLAVDRRFKREGQPEADFFKCVAFGKLGEFVEKYLKKGSKIVVSGEVQNNNYTDNNGNKVYAMQFVLDEINFAESKNNSESSTKTSDGFMNIPDGVGDELPFN